MQLGLGTAALGRPQYINIRDEYTPNGNIELFKQQSFSVLEKAYQLGVRYFDTAPGYGLAENLMIEWLQTKNDPSIQTATKWGYTYVANFDANAKIHEIKEHSLAKLNEQWEVSKTLKPNLNIYQIHSATIETGVLQNDAILNRLSNLKNEHHLKIGITTTGSNQVEVIKKALDVSVEGKQLFDTFQSTYNILDQSLASIIPTLKQEGKLFIIKEALANGRLFPNKKYSKYTELYIVLRDLALKYNVGIDALALQFCEATLQPDIVLSGASNMYQLEQNLKSISLIISEEDIQQLAAFGINSEVYWEERKQLQWN